MYSLQATELNNVVFTKEFFLHLMTVFKNLPFHYSQNAVSVTHHNHFSCPILDPYHAYRNLEQNSLQHHDSNNINQNFSSQPYFDFSVPRNVTTRVGQTAFLNCRVEQLGDKLVSWLPSDSLSCPPSASTPIRITLRAEWYFFQFTWALKIIYRCRGEESRCKAETKNNIFLLNFPLKVSWIRKRDLHILR